MGGAVKGPPPPNKKYANVKAKLDTGCNELKVRSSENKANARFHRGENFRRLKVYAFQAATALCILPRHMHSLIAICKSNQSTQDKKIDQ